MAWRARTHHLSRNPRFLLRTSLIIVGIGLALAVAIVTVSHTPRQITLDGLISTVVDPGREHLRESLQELNSSPDPQPRRLARWLRRACLMESTDTEPSSTPEASPHPAPASTAPLTLGGQEISPILDRHAPDPTLRQRFLHYITAALKRDPSAARAAYQCLETEAALADPPPLANQLLAQLLVQDRQTARALEAFILEGRHFPDAAPARSEALHWAVQLQDLPRLRTLLAMPGWADDADPAMLYHAAGLVGDVWLQWKTLVHLRLKDLPLAKLSLALFAASLWYVILVQVAGLQGRWRWTWPLLPLMAGVASIWPTLSLVTFQEHNLGLSQDAPFPHNLWYFFGGIGLREELCKLLLFTPFLPWLLQKRQPGLALVTGAFVGLGFALEENINYYDASGGSVVWGRFITANFMHLALTGIAAHGLYVTARSGFNRVSDFAGAFIGVVAAHGLYDLVILLDSAQLQGLGLLSIVILALLARHFFTLASQLSPARRGPVAPIAVFFIGSAVLIAALFVVAASIGGTHAAIAEVGTGCLGIVPIGFMFWQHLH